MKTDNTLIRKWTRIAAILSTLILAMTSVVAPASARVIFENDAFYKVQSEGININEDDAGDEDVTLKFGNDGTDATIIFDDGTGDTTLATPGGDFNFSDDNITTTGNISGAGITASGTLDANGQVDLGDGGDTVSITSSSWGVTTAGVASGLTGLTSTGAVDFSGASSFAMHQGAANPGTCTEGALFYNTSDNITYVCTAANTWTSLSSGGTPNFEGVYGADGDDTLTTSDGAFTIARGTGAFAITGTGTTTIGTSTFDVNATGNVTIDSSGGTIGIGTNADAQNINIGTGAAARTVTVGNNTGASALNLEAGSGEIDITTSGLLDLNSGAFSLDGSTVSIDGTDTMNLTMTANQATDRTLSIGATNAGAGNGLVSINSDVWDISSSGIASGFAGITSTGTINFSGAGSFRIREAADEAGATCTTANEIILDTTEDRLYICTTPGSPGTWSALGSNVSDGTVANRTLRWNGTSWVESAALTNDNTDIGVTNNLDVGGTITAGSSNVTITNAAGNIDGEIIANDTIDEDSIDWGTGAGQISAADMLIADAGGYTTETQVEGALQEIYGQIGSNAPNVDTLYFQPEFPDAVIFGDGTFNKGTLEALYDDSQAGDRAYYNWSTTQAGTANDINIQFHFKLPADYAGTPSFSVDYRTNDTTEANNDVEISVYNATNETSNNPTLCETDATNVSAVADSWATATLNTFGGCTGGTALDPGDVILVELKMIADGDISGSYADVGPVEFTYAN